MKRLCIKLLLLTSLVSVGVMIATAQNSHADCAPQVEQLIPAPNMIVHMYSDPDCPIDYYSTPEQDQYEIGRVMPTFHVTPQEAIDQNSLVHMHYPINADFSGRSDILQLKLTFSGGPDPFTPYNITVIGHDGYTEFQGNRGPGSGQPSSDAIVTWYALGGDDVLIGGDYGIDFSYGGPGNDIYNIANNEDRALENPDEGFDVVTVTPTAPNYKFDYPTSIEAIYLYPGATVDRNFLPPNVIFVENLIDNRGPSSNYNVDEYIKGTPYNDAIYGGSGDGTITADKGNDVASGGAGNDTVDGGSGNDALAGGSGDDNVKGGSGNDLIVGGSGEGNDTYNGGSGKDTVKYTSAQASITVNLSALANQAYSTDGADGAKIGVDQIALVENVIAGNFDDLITGNKAANQLEGEDGNDIIRGEAGKDILIGGKGDDVLFGGASVDKFVYRQTEESGVTPETADTIADFTVKGEKIDFAAIDASTLIDGNNAFLFNGGAAIGVSNEGEVSVVKIDNPDTANDYTMVYIDTDADPAPEASIRLNGLLNLTIKNFAL